MGGSAPGPKEGGPLRVTNRSARGAAAWLGLGFGVGLEPGSGLGLALELGLGLGSGSGLGSGLMLVNLRRDLQADLERGTERARRVGGGRRRAFRRLERLQRPL